MAVGDAYVFPGFLAPVLTQLFFPKPPTTFLTCFCRGERRKYALKIGGQSLRQDSFLSNHSPLFRRWSRGKATSARGFHNSYVVRLPVAWSEYSTEYWLNELQKSMGKYTDRRGMTKIMLKTGLTTLNH